MSARHHGCWGWLGLGALALGACEPPPEPVAEPPWPSTEACEGLDDWPDDWAALEHDAVVRIDAVRQHGADCGVRGKLGPAHALVRRPALDCAARLHAQDMATEGYQRQIDGDGHDVRWRVEAAGATPAVVIQHIAAGPRSAEELVDQTWLPRAIPCESLGSSEVDEIGLGVVADVDDPFETYWVLVLASES